MVSLYFQVDHLIQTLLLMGQISTIFLLLQHIEAHNYILRSLSVKMEKLDKHFVAEREVINGRKLGFSIDFERWQQLGE